MQKSEMRSILDTRALKRASQQTKNTYAWLTGESEELLALEVSVVEQLKIRVVDDDDVEGLDHHTKI